MPVATHHDSGRRECDRCGLVGSAETLELMPVRLGDHLLAELCPRCVPALIVSVASQIPAGKRAPDLERWHRVMVLRASAANEQR